MPTIDKRTAPIRQLTPDELPKAAEMRRLMVLELDGEDYDLAYPGWRERFAAFFGGHLQAGDGAFFVAEHDDAIIGTSAAYLVKTHRAQTLGRPSAYICQVYVRPEWRRRGLARVLTSAAVEWSRARGCEVVRLRTSKMGRPVYEGLGFRQTDELELRF
ncbi:MAG: GNAT family N-acetyltransferase [Candidatus Eremiobacteraeota bacterium]|nr:GNAT family N-acetyltransferase [Candidatus Eremiobacteraeota bacterium]MBV8595105.1 GNAT family N-acetyltransferase [Candidatus Eremiobacteraeota bacterium]